MTEQRIKFQAEVWRYQGKAAWFFATLPPAAANQIRYYHPQRGGFGSVPVRVVIGESCWKTSIFPDKQTNSFLLPLKKAIRAAEQIKDQQEIDVSLFLAL